MKVFLSWSGDYSRSVASVFAEWLPCVLQQVNVFMSTNAIEAGDRWSDVISEALGDIDFGLLFITDDNKEKPWLLFEAGALAKNISRSKVIPILIDAKEIDLSKSPLFGFQYKDMTKEGIFGVMRSIHQSLPDAIIDRATLNRCLEKWWPELEEAYSSIEIPKAKKPSPKLSEDERLNRIEHTLSDVLGAISRSNLSSKPTSSNKKFSLGETLVMSLENMMVTEGPNATEKFIRDINNYNALDAANKVLVKSMPTKHSKFLINAISNQMFDAEIPF